MLKSRLTRRGSPRRGLLGGRAGSGGGERPAAARRATAQGPPGTLHLPPTSLEPRGTPWVAPPAGALVSSPLLHTSAPPGALRGLPNSLDRTEAAALRTSHPAPALWSGGSGPTPCARSSGAGSRQRVRCSSEQRSVSRPSSSGRVDGGQGGRREGQGGRRLFPFLPLLAAQRPAEARLRRQARDLWPPHFRGQLSSNRDPPALSTDRPQSRGDRKLGVFLGRGREAVGILHFRALALDPDRDLDLNPLLLPCCWVVP